MVYHGLTWLNYDDLSWPTMIFPTIGINSGDCICSASNLPVFEVYLHFWTNAKGNFHRNSWLDPRFKHSPFLYIKPSVFFMIFLMFQSPRCVVEICWNPPSERQHQQTTDADAQRGSGRHADALGSGLCRCHAELKHFPFEKIDGSSHLKEINNLIQIWLKHSIIGGLTMVKPSQNRKSNTKESHEKSHENRQSIAFCMSWWSYSLSSTIFTEHLLKSLKSMFAFCTGIEWTHHT